MRDLNILMMISDWLDVQTVGRWRLPSRPQRRRRRREQVSDLRSILMMLDILSSVGRSVVVFHIQYCGYKSELHGFIFIAVRTATMTTYCYICITQVPPNVLSFTRSNEFESPRSTTVQTPSANRSPIAIIVEYTRSDHVDGLLYRSMVEERTSQAMEEDRRVWGRWTTLEAIRKENPWRSWWWWWSPLMNYIIIIVVGGSFLYIQSLYSI